MDVLTLSTQKEYKYDKEYIVWAIELSTKVLLKMHVNEKNISDFALKNISKIDIFKDKIKQQEVWVKSAGRIGPIPDKELIELLDIKASTPYSVKNRTYYGNLVKVESFEDIDCKQKIIKVLLVGFMRELFFVNIFDGKWYDYLANTDEVDLDGIKAFAKRKNIYLIIDYPKDGSNGYLDGAAMVVV